MSQALLQSFKILLYSKAQERLIPDVNLARNSRPQPLSGFFPSVLLYCCFSDIDELASYVPEGNVRMTQLSLQPLRCDSMSLYFETVRFSFNRLNCSVSVVGDKTPGFLCFVCLPHSANRPVISHGLSITADYLYGFDPNRGVDMVFPEHTTHCAISIRQDVFEACTEAMDRPDLNTKFFAPNYLYIPETLPRLQAYLNQIYRMLNQRSPLLQRPNFQQLILQDFLPLLVTSLPLQQDPLKTTVKSFQRSHLVKQAEDYMQSHLNRPLTLTDLCNALGTSSRALSYGFREIFGMSPMAYLKILRLQGVHRALKAGDPSNKTIANIAHQFGFWSLGHFTRDYKQMFGKLPSETFKQ